MQPVVFNANLEEALNLVGTFVFAISGALLAVHKRYDIVGMTVLAEITAIGGGVIRDLILGAVPPAAFTDRITFLLPVAAVALIFFVYRFILHGDAQNETGIVQRFRDRIQTAFVRRYRNQLATTVLIFDAAGLAVFCVSGTAKALAFRLGPIEAIALGTLTGVGGGIMRDVLANERPTILQAGSQLYAVPAVLGSAIVVAAQYLGLYGSLLAGLAAIFVFILRLAAIRYGWQAPQPKRGEPHGDTGVGDDKTLEDT
ncbi:MAG TPA: trimeric intracellular cation channel family protein [Ktedonobacterales bacterium]|nr:trimeric intracellular cation channel family protein [Ktedonobacterales bacterium]